MCWNPFHPTDLSISPYCNLFSSYLPFFSLFPFLPTAPPRPFSLLYSETLFLAIYFIKNIISSIASEKKLKSLFLIILLSERFAYRFNSFSAHHFLFTIGWKQKFIEFSLHTGGGGYRKCAVLWLEHLIGEETFTDQWITGQEQMWSYIKHLLGQC